MTLDELRARLTEVKAGIVALDEQHQGQYIDPASEAGRSYNDLNAEHDELVRTIAQGESRQRRVAEIAQDVESTSDDPRASFLARRPGAVTGADIYDLSTVRSSVTRPEDMVVELHDRAKRAIDGMTFAHDRADREQCQEAITRLLANVDDKQGTIAQRVLKTSSPSYKQAFGQWISSGGAQAAGPLQVGTDSLGGFAVPVELDPTILPTSDGVVNPYRQISRVVQTTAKTWEGVSSAGVVATRRGEGDEADDNSPTLAQPTAETTRVDVFIPFTIELQASWSGMQGELARMIQDAKDVEEVSSFTTGDGSDPNPQGLITGATITVSTATTAVFASPDLDAVEDGLGSRFRSRAQWMGSRTVYNLIRHFADDNGPDLWVRIADPLNRGGNIGHTLLGYQANENSSMATATTSNSKILVLGDFAYFLIVDKIGLNMELVPHLFGSNGRPTGTRGFFAYWNNTSKVLSPNAFRVLKVK
jgi:HK97 family phage major capsid protein